MKSRRGYMGVQERSNPSLNEGYMRNIQGYMRGTKKKRGGVHEGYRRDQTPVSMKGTGRKEAGT